MEVWTIILAGVTLLASSSVLVELIKTRKDRKQHERERAEKKEDKKEEKEEKRNDMTDQLEQMVALLNSLHQTVVSVSENQTHVSKGLMVLLVDKIEHFGRKYMEANEITFEEREVLKSIHTAAHTLGCDEGLDEIMDRVLLIPVKKQDDKNRGEGGKT